MSKKYQAFPGMEDILPGEIEKWQWLENQARNLFEGNSLCEIRTPILEPTELFVRSIGETSDIVNKEMYTFEDRGERSMTMRPEMTASVARAVIEHGLLKTSQFLQLYYIGPMFRAERPQAGRKRQFHQIGVEFINKPVAQADFNVIWLINHFLKKIGLMNFTIKINDLGDLKSRPTMIEKLKDYFQRQKSHLCKDCQWRLEKNVLRIFDCKIESCQPIIDGAPWDDIAPKSQYFENLLSDLIPWGINCEHTRRLVRGLDYYNGVVFEVSAPGLGAQDAIAGGGRYDHLYSELGYGEVPCTGFSIGIERLLMAVENADPKFKEKIFKKRVYVAPLFNQTNIQQDINQGAEIYNRVVEMVIYLRTQGIEAVMGELSENLQAHLKKADKLGYPFVVYANFNDVQTERWKYKSKGKPEQAVSKETLVTELKQGMNL